MARERETVRKRGMARESEQRDVEGRRGTEDEKKERQKKREKSREGYAKKKVLSGKIPGFEFALILLFMCLCQRVCESLRSSPSLCVFVGQSLSVCLLVATACLSVSDSNTDCTVHPTKPCGSLMQMSKYCCLTERSEVGGDMGLGGGRVRGWVVEVEVYICEGVCLEVLRGCI